MTSTDAGIALARKLVGLGMSQERANEWAEAMERDVSRELTPAAKRILAAAVRTIVESTAQAA